MAGVKSKWWATNPTKKEFEYIEKLCFVMKEEGTENILADERLSDRLKIQELQLLGETEDFLKSLVLRTERIEANLRSIVNKLNELNK